MNEEVADIGVGLIGGNNLLTSQVLFTKESEYFFSSDGSDIIAYKTDTGDCIERMKTPSDRPLVGLVRNPDNCLQIFSCNRDGRICQWDFLDGILIKSFLLDVEAPVFAFRLLVDKKNGGLHFLVLTKSRLKFVVYDFEATVTIDSMSSGSKSVLFKNVDATNHNLDFGFQNRFVASSNGSSLLIYNRDTRAVKSVDEPSSIQTSVRSGSTITCLACHPMEECVATGSRIGRILIWRHFLRHSKPVVSALHWHSLPVLSLCFTCEGGSLLSGGHECVLVKWSGDDGRKEILPRLGAPIQSISCSPDNQHYAVGLADNSIKLVSSTWFVEQIIHGWCRSTEPTSASVKPSGSNRSCGLHYDPRTGSLVANGKPGHLQFFRVPECQLLHHLDVIGQNFVSRTEFDQPVNFTHVTHMALSSDAYWLATIQRWESPTNDFSSEMILRFWLFDEQQQRYSLAASFERPHKDRVSSLRFSTDGQTLVSTSIDSTFKLWRVVAKDIDSDPAWSLCDICSFWTNTHPQPHACISADFSFDDTALAVAFDQYVTLWGWDITASKCHKHSVLPLPPICLDGEAANDEAADAQMKPSVRCLLFSKSESSAHLLIVAYDRAVVVWNLLETTVVWTHLLCPTSIALSSSSSNVAVFATNKVFVMRVSDGEVLYEKELSQLSQAHSESDSEAAEVITNSIFVPRATQVHQGDGQSIKGAIAPALPSWTRDDQLFFSTNLQNVYTVDAVDHFKPKLPDRINLDEDGKAANLNPLQYLLAAADAGSLNESFPLDDYQQQGLVYGKTHPAKNFPTFEKFIHTSAYVLPSSLSIAPHLIKSLLPIKANMKDGGGLASAHNSRQDQTVASDHAEELEASTDEKGKANSSPSTSAGFTFLSSQAETADEVMEQLNDRILKWWRTDDDDENFFTN